jgi:transposase
MAMGKREAEEQRELFVMAGKLPQSPGHVFYDKLNRVLREGGFDRHVEAICEPYYAKGKGRPSVPPGVYFRMLLVGYFEGINSQRGIAWRCSDSLSLRKFLGIALGADSPDHSSLSYIRKRRRFEVHRAVFRWILALAQEKKLLKGKTVAVDSTTLEANAAMKSIERKDTGEDWNEYLARLMKEEGLLDDRDDDDPPSADELRTFDKSRENKRVSNEEWQSPTDPDSRIAKMKDGTTHLAYKAEHVVDLDTEMILAAEIYHADRPDTQTLEDSVNAAQTNQREAGSEQQIEDVVADRSITRTSSSRTCASTRRIARTSPSRSRRTIARGPTNRRSSRPPCMPIAGERAGSAAESCNGSAARRQSGPSLTCVRLAARDAAG